MNKKMTKQDLVNYIISEANKLVNKTIVKETRLDYMDDLIGGKPSSLPDEETRNLKSWLCIYEENGEFSLYEKYQYVAKDYEGEYIDTENNYYNKINKDSDIEEIKKFFRRIYELASAHPDYAKFKLESVSCGVHEEFDTFQELTDAAGKCIFKLNKK